MLHLRSLYPKSSPPSSANSGGPGTVALLAESGWDWQRSKPSFMVIHTYQAWKYLGAPSWSSVIFLTPSPRATRKRLKRQSPQVSLNFLGEWTDVDKVLFILSSGQRCSCRDMCCPGFIDTHPLCIMVTLKYSHQGNLVSTIPGRQHLWPCSFPAGKAFQGSVLPAV